ncbi:beclin 1-associated autophagy-related key regulator isoform X1 [Tribolium madens]|uniref:beclin 1-associated autophagy-related key regulator isoform X1 n=1 Tax=Tribolium madens TaxID=41895 RepID=UPI001CF76288|nr:beclin 1-associated autophagy-related key regulator isoform X1 [Tribolium madens]
MATSSSDESSTAPKDFHISSSIDSGSRLSLSRQKCLLCCNSRKVFYCKDCIHSGLFYHSKHQVAESYLDKRKLLLELEDNKKNLEKKCLKHFESRQKADVLHSKIRQCRDRNRIIKLAVEEKKQKRLKYIADLNRLKEEVKRTSEKLIKYDQKVSQIEQYAADKRDKVEKQRELLEQKRREIMKLVRLRIDQLKYVFPIKKVEPKLEVESAESDMVSAIAEASQTMYVRDRWEYADFLTDSSELQYSIVEPTLPGSGNYSLYNFWVSKNKDVVPVNPNPDLVEHNPGYNISAALTYTAQLINVLAFYFNVRLPYRMVYSDFCGSYMDEAQFTRRVARLNANVLYLCFSQNIDLSYLKACETIHNLLRLIDTSNPHLGRQGPFEVDGHQAESLEKPLTRDLEFSGDNTDSDEGDSFHREWETVPHIPCPDVSTVTPPVQSAQMITTQQATSMAGGLVTSAAQSLASMWRGFTGR